MIRHHSNGAGTDLRGELVRRLACHRPYFSRVGVSGKAGAVHLAAGLIIAWVRVIGEFGIVMVFAYFPQGMSVKLFINLQNEGVDAVYALLWLMLAVTLPLPLLTLFLMKGGPGADCE